MVPLRRRGEEWPHPQIRIHALHRVRVQRSIGVGRQGSIANSFADQRAGDRMVDVLRLLERLRADGPQVGGDFISQHFFETEARKSRESF